MLIHYSNLLCIIQCTNTFTIAGTDDHYPGGDDGSYGNGAI